MSDDETAPLPATPTRQADAMLRACEYQILQTVSAWLDLRGEEVIYVEGAEDFDIHSRTEAEAIQVKTSPQPISLGQKEVQKTINHYWQLRGAAAGRQVRMRFLTCAPFTIERGSPFGDGVAGLEMWQRRPLTDDEVRQLANFLTKQPHLQSAVRSWLGKASPVQIRDELVERLTWQSRAEEAHFVERSIYNKLAAFAEKRGPVPASVTRRVGQRLIEEVWKTLRKPAPRRLDFFRIEELWEEAARVSIPRSALDAWLSERRVPPEGFDSGPVELLRNGVPPLPGGVARRAKLVEEWRQSLAARRLLNLHGSTRTGKTTLAKLIALPDSDEWKWWSAARKKPNEIQRALQMLVLEVARSPDTAHLVLDDIDFSPIATQGMEETLGELLALVSSRRGRVLVTSQKPLPIRLQHAFGVEDRQIVLVPRLNDEEVADLAAALGCADEKHRMIWARLVRASTEGHPQLAAVRLLSLKEKGWPAVSLEALDVGAQAVDAERADARQMLEGLPESQGMLLQRLSVFPVAFRREHAVALGANPPPIAAPGNAFDPLVGPWIEPLHADYFALSPLFLNGARAALATRDFEDLQTQAAMVLLRTKPCTTLDAANAFLLLWQTQNAVAIVQLFESWLKMKGEVFTQFAENLWWFTFVSITPGQRLYAKNAIVSLFLRWLQFRIAVSTTPKSAGAIVEAWQWELANSTYPQPTLYRMIFAGEVLPHHLVPLPAARVVRLLQNVADAVATHPDMPWPQSLSRGEDQELDYLPEWKDVVSTLSFLSTPRCANAQFLEEYLKALEATESRLRDRILRGFIGGGIEVQIALDRVWLGESEREAPDWPRCLRVFHRAFELGRMWGCLPLASAAMRGICVVIDEYIKDHGKAHQELDRMSEAGDLASYAVHDRRACIFFSEANYAAAEKEWGLALAEWPRKLAPFDSGAAFAARSAGVSAAREGRWLAAADWFKQIIERLPTKRETAFIAGAYADAGYCLWKSGRASEAIAALIEAWRLADSLPVGKENLRAFITRKTIGHVIAWLHSNVTTVGVGDLHEPLAGTCSSAEMPEQMRELPETKSAHIWLFLKRLERELGAGNLATELGRPALSASKDQATRALAAMEEIMESLQAGKVANLPAEIIEWTRILHAAAAFAPSTLASAVTRIPPEVFQKSDPGRGAAVFLAALVVIEAQGGNWPEPLADWRASLPPNVDDGWSEWFDTIARILGGSAAEAALQLRSMESDWANAMLAAWHLLLSEESSPEDVFYAHARWLGLVSVSPWLQQTGEPFCFRIEVAWTRVISTPALLRQPRLSIPVIQEAVVSGKRGLSRAARILLAASFAVQGRMAPEMEAAIREIAQKS